MYKLFMVEIIYSIPVAASTPEAAEKVARNLFDDNLESYDTLGFDDANYKVEEVTEVPESWDGVDLFNEDDVNCLTAEMVLKGFSPDMQELARRAEVQSRIQDLLRSKDISLHELHSIVEGMM